MRFAQISDTHIRNYKYQKEYRQVFSQLYKTLKEENVDFIIHTGDIAHTKTQISPEFVELASDFLSSLADIAPTYVLLGNHDGNLKNSARQDALTPIVQNLKHPDLHLFKGYEQVNPQKSLFYTLCAFLMTKPTGILSPIRTLSTLPYTTALFEGLKQTLGGF